MRTKIIIDLQIDDSYRLMSERFERLEDRLRDLIIEIVDPVSGEIYDELTGNSTSIK